MKYISLPGQESLNLTMYIQRTVITNALECKIMEIPIQRLIYHNL